MEQERRKKKGKHSKKKGKKIIKILIFFIILLVCIGLFLLYGPYNGFRDWLITTAMTTMNHQYLATWFYSDETIQEVLKNNRVDEVNENTDVEKIYVKKEKKKEEKKNQVAYENEYERQILEKDDKNNDYKVIKINGKGYEGYLVAIYDPSRVKVATTKYLGSSGQYLTDIAKQNNALVAINGGGFEDEGGSGLGGSPLGITVKNKKYLSAESYYGSGGLIGFDDNNNMVVGKMNVSQAKSYNIRDAVTFSPFLITNGKASRVQGNGGWGTGPRTAMGQRKDGIVLFLVLDGRTLQNPGAQINDLIDIMQNYGAVTAANLDGGTSTALVINGKIVNNPTNLSGNHSTRPICTAFILEKDDSDDSDHSIVADKLKK